MYSYGGDIEFWAGKVPLKGAGRQPPWTGRPATFPSTAKQPKAAHVYKQQEKVTSIVALVDSRMDGQEQFHL